MHKENAGQSHHLTKWGIWLIVSSPEGAGMLRRHRPYIDSTPSIMAAIAAAIEEAEERMGADDFASPDNTLSSLRAQPDFRESSAGQTTRLKFAL
jgi:hypothetical protein